MVGLLLKLQLGDSSDHTELSADDIYPVHRAMDDMYPVYQAMDDMYPFYPSTNNDYHVYHQPDDVYPVYQVRDDEVDTTADMFADLQVEATDVDKVETKKPSRKSRRNAVRSRIWAAKKELEKLKNAKTPTASQIKKKSAAEDRLARLETEMRELQDEVSFKT